MSGLDQLILFTTDLLALFAVYLIINIGLNLQQGITGIPNFGILFAVAGGAYFTGGLSTRLALSLLGIHTDLSPIFEASPGASYVFDVDCFSAHDDEEDP